MRAIVAIAILCLVLLLGWLTVYILLRRLGTSSLDSYRRKRRQWLEPQFLAWLEGSGPAPPPISSPRRLVDRGVVVELALARLPAASPTERALLVDWLQRQGMTSRWIRELSARSSWRRGTAAERLAVVRDEGSVGPLIALLDDPVFDVRMRAAKALGALGGLRARKALVGALGDENRWSVIRITDLLADMGPEVVGELVDAFPGLGRASRLATLDLIARLGDARLTLFLAGLLDDLDRDVRARAASALGRVGDLTATPALTVALQDAEWPVRAMAAKALGLLGAASSADALAASLRDREWWVRANAAEALCRMPPAGPDRLVAMLDDQDRFARDQALSALESSGELTRRIEALLSPEPAARQEARVLIRILSQRQPRGRIDALLDRHGDDALRAEIVACMRQQAANPGAAP